MAFREYGEIEDYRIDEGQFLKTGIEKLDHAILGLGLGQLVIVTGTRAGGKTTFVGQLTCNFIDHGYSGLICSFEMANPRLKNWLTLQALGADNLKGYTTSTGKILYYPKTKEVKKAVDDWIGAKLKVYDNSDFEADKICTDITEEINKNPKIKFVILDNLMKIEMDGLDDNKYESQSKIVKVLQRYAQRKNICIILVAHPNKVKTLPRIEDVGGSGDIINTADTVLLIHRVTDDFKIRAHEYFKWNDDNPAFNYGNLIEIAKDREFGDDDSMVGVYFEPRSKRFLNNPNEVVKYGWDKSPSQSKIPMAEKGYSFTDLSEDEEIPF